MEFKKYILKLLIVFIAFMFNVYIKNQFGFVKKKRITYEYIILLW